MSATTHVSGAEEGRSAKARRASLASWKKTRDGRGHPVTADLEYTDDEVEFMFAVQAFKEKHRKTFPTWCEVLLVIRALGYSKV